MELQALYRSKFAIIVSASFMISCTSNESKNLYTNSDSVSHRTSRGVLYVNDKVYTGILYTLFPNSADTSSVRGFDSGKEEGMQKEFYRGGKLKSLRFFHLGKKEGKYEAWWENGQKRLSYSFEKDEYNGSCKEWTSEGMMIRNMNYHNGQENGLQQAWDLKGKQVANYEAKNGRNYGLTGIKGCATLWENDTILSR